jgi:hypothetical protein
MGGGNIFCSVSGKMKFVVARKNGKEKAGGLGRTRRMFGKFGKNCYEMGALRECKMQNVKCGMARSA